MKALITGGFGFVGRHLREHLETCGDLVTSIDLECDVTDVASLTKVFGEVAPDAIYHLAALSHVGTSWEDPSEVLRVNVIGTSCVLAAARSACPDATILVTSSAEVYGKVPMGNMPITEVETTRPSSPYAASKLAAEAVAQQAVTGYGQRVVIARPFNHCGPGQAPSFFIPAMVQRLREAAKNGDSDIPVGNLSSRRDYTDVRDVVRAYRALVMSGVSGEVYNVASGVAQSMQETAELLRNLIAPGVDLRVDSSLVRPVDVPLLLGSCEKLQRATQWVPAISFPTSLHDVMNS